jgi:hypothetical protein
VAFGCPKCGFVDSDAGGIRAFLFDSDVVGTRTILLGQPLHALCRNCGSLHQRYAGFVFALSEPPYGVVSAPDADLSWRDSVAAQFDVPADKVTVTHELDEAVRAVRTRLVELANVKDPGKVGGSDAGLCPGGRRCSCDGQTEEVLR